MTDRPPVTRGAKIFGQVATIIVLGGGLLLVVLIILYVAAKLIKGI